MGAEFDDDRPVGAGSPPRTRAARRGKSVLAIRAMAGETEWLDGDPLWADGRVVWGAPRGLFAPTAADLALAQRRLNQIAGHPVSAQCAFGDAVAWLEGRQSRLALAKHLQRLREPDLAALARRAKASGGGGGGGDDAAASLVRLLVAEAYCLNDLPTRPSAALVAGGTRAEDPVRRALGHSDFPPFGRALAALVLGAVRRDGGGPVAAGLALSPHERRAYAWGRTAGLPADPALLVAILSDRRGTALARRYMSTRDPINPFLLKPADLRRLIARPTPVSRVIAVTEAVAAAAPLADLITSYRDQLPEREDVRHAAAQELQRERHDALAAIGDLIHSYAMQTADPALVGVVTRFIDTTLRIGPIRRALIDALAVELRQTLTLPYDLQRTFLDLLLAEHARLWPPDGYAGALDGNSVQSWLQHRQRRQVRPLRELLLRTRAIDLTREAFDLGIHEMLAAHEWKDRALYRLAVSLMRRFGTTSSWEMCAFFDFALTATQARTALQPITQALAEAPTPAREAVFHAAMELTWNAGAREVGDRLRRLSHYVAPLVSFAQTQVSAGETLPVPVEEILALDREAPDRAREWVEWLLHVLLPTADGGHPHPRIGPGAEQAVRLAAIVAHGDAARFQDTVQAALAHDFDYSWDVLEQSIEALRQYPRLHPPLAHLFAQQPHRCMAAVVNAGLVARLGPDVAAPLRRADGAGTVDHSSVSSEWQAVLVLTPAAAPWVGRYLAAREEGGEGLDVPPAVRKAMDQPRRWAAEMDHLRRLIDAHPARADLRTRLSNLRSRLADTEQVETALRDEVMEHLQQWAADAQLVAVERTIHSCYRLYLDRVAGPLLPGLTISEDLRNAVLLSADIRANRRPLLRLLRAYLAGDRRWPERHPANRRFLEGLTGAGVDTRVWLSAHPRVYPCAAAAGRRLHLSLERDPLRVLQMGNLFDTCLSFGGINAFSTVANACELNKRVLYIRDGKGRIIGRKLIGIAGQGELVGFRTYGGLHDEAGNAALKGIVRTYCERFAAACGLHVADDGVVPQLFVKEWYDDGVVPWDQDVATRPTRESAGGDDRGQRSGAERTA